MVGNAWSVRFTHYLASRFGDYYFHSAESSMKAQWAEIIEPRLRRIPGLDMRIVLELAPGYGRNSEMLLPLIHEELHLVDANRLCIERCQARFADYAGPVRLYFHVNDGTSLSTIASASVTFVYTFDSMVHFDESLTSAYIHEFARVLLPGGTAFVHHSNAGQSTRRFWLLNRARRGAVALDQVAAASRAAGLEVLSQEPLPFGNSADLDGITVLRRPL